MTTIVNQIRETVKEKLNKHLDYKKCKNLDIAIYNWTLDNSKYTKEPIFTRNKKKMLNDDKPIFMYAKMLHDTKYKYEHLYTVYVLVLYKQKARSIISNLENVPGLRDRINNDNAVLKSFPYLSDTDIHPILYEPILKAKQKREVATHLFYNDDQEHGLFKCDKCMSMNTTNYQVQTRSADEPMTIYITCKNCGSIRKE